MSDDEDLVYIKKQKTIHYGSFEEQERARLIANAAAKSDDEDGLPTNSVDNAGLQINISNGTKYSVTIL